MAVYLKSTRDFFYNRRKPFIVVGGVVGGLYMVANYAVTKLTEVQSKMVEEKRDRENLKRRFAQNQEDCNFTTLALLPTLGDQLFQDMDVEGLTAQLQRGRQPTSAPLVAEPKPAIEGPFKVKGASDADDCEKAMVGHGQANGHVVTETPNEAMEEIWRKLGSKSEGDAPLEQASETAGMTTSATPNGDTDEVKQDSQEGDTSLHSLRPSNGVTHQPSSDIVKEPKANGDDEAVPVSQIQSNGVHDIADGPMATSSNLDSVAEPAPLPIPPQARLSPSPSSTPAALQVAPSKGTDADLQSSEASAAVDGAAGIVSSDLAEDKVATTQEEEEAPTAEERLAEKKEKLLLWNELKITAFSRTLTTLYALVLLSLQTHVQLNLLGRYAYLTSVASFSTPASSTHHQIRLERHDGTETSSAQGDGQEGREEYESGLGKGIDLQTERLYLTFSWYFLHEGWRELADSVKEAVEDVLGDMPLKSQLTHQEFLLLLNKMRRRVEYEARDEGASTMDGRSELSETTVMTSRKRGKRRTFLSVLFPPPSQELSVLERAGAIDSSFATSSGGGGSSSRPLGDLSPNLPLLLDETKDLLESPDFARILHLCLNRVFTVFESTLRPTFGVEPSMNGTPAEMVDGLLRQSSAAVTAAVPKSTAAFDQAFQSTPSRFQQLTEDGQAGIRVRLASLFPAVARQSSAAINGVPNEYVEALSEIKELKAFSAVIYSSWE